MFSKKKAVDSYDNFCFQGKTNKLNDKKEITVVELKPIVNIPPVQNLIRILLEKGYQVNLIGREVNEIANDIKNNDHFKALEVLLYPGKNHMLKKIINYIYKCYIVNHTLRNCMETSDVLWMTSIMSLRTAGKNVLKYKTVVQVLELRENAYFFKHYFKLPIKKYAQAAWKTVVPEINRAYIQKIWWDLKKTPVVLPNKPYTIDYGEITADMKEAVSVLSNEKRKIVLYLGGIYEDREFENYAKAISKMEGFVFCIVGKAFTDSAKILLEKLQKDYHAIYLGAYNPPKHLVFVPYARIGLLPYKPVKGTVNSELNALYCAPNKIFEYAGFGVPMVGSDVLGLKLPFEQWDIGRCCDMDDEVAIRQAIEYVDARYDTMKPNCYQFYDSVDLNKIVSEILED